jgi:hypothetical protein
MGVIPFRHEGLGNSAYLLDLSDGSGALIDLGRIAEDYLSLGGVSAPVRSRRFVRRVDRGAYGPVSGHMGTGAVADGSLVG